MCFSDARASSSSPAAPRRGRRGEVREHLFHAHRVEHRLRFAQPDAGRRDAQQNASPVARIAIPPHVCAPLQAIDRQRHRRHRDAHVPGEVGDDIASTSSR
jgi:hypothetical protein